jgi:formylglycine-generating enzyme required for sulfatase activity
MKCSFAEYYTALYIENNFLLENRIDFKIPSKEVADFICFEKDNLRFIPGGKFLMGEKGKQHEVKVDSFYIGIYPVTNQEYEQFDPAHREKRNKISSADDEPVINVLWEETNLYFKWLSEKKGYIYRLPTEVEWEYACRAGSRDLYSQDINGSEVTEKNFREYAVYRTRKVMPVKQQKPNFYGLYDMHGNVWEWCQDYYSDIKQFRVLRGGSYASLTEDLRASYRDYYDPDYEHEPFGFRVVVTVARTP